MKKTKKKGITEIDDILQVLIELEKLKKERTRHVSMKSKWKNHLNYKQTTNIERQNIIAHLKDLDKIVRNLEVKRFERFLELIISIRNIDSLSGKYTKRHFLSEVDTYLTNTKAD